MEGLDAFLGHRALDPCRLTAWLLSLIAALGHASVAQAPRPIVALDDPSTAAAVGCQPDGFATWRPEEGLRSLPDRPLVLVGPRRLERGDAEALLDALLCRQAMVVLPDGLSPEAAANLGIALWDAPAGTHEVWAAGPWEGLGWSPPRDGAPNPMAPVLGLPASLLDRAEYRALLVTGRARDIPLATVGLGLRYHSGPWRGGGVVVVSPGLGSWNPFGRDGRALARVVEWAGSPLVADPWFDYPLVRAGEELRLPVEALVRHDDHRPLTIAVTLRGADGRAISCVDGIVPIRERGDGFLDSLSSIVRFEGRRWPRPSVVADVEVRHEREVVASGRGMVVTWEPSVLRRAAPSSVTGRRLVVAGSGEPVLGIELRRPWRPPGGLPAEYRDLLAWGATFAQVADAGVHLVRLGSSMAVSPRPGEYERRLDAALLMLADSHGVAVEMMPVISGGRPVLLDELSDPRIAPSLLLSAGTSSGLALLRERWPASRIAPAPAAPTGGELPAMPPESEAQGRLGLEPVRLSVRGGAMDVSAAMEVAALGFGGTLLVAEEMGVAPQALEALTAAKLVTSLLQPSAHQPDLAVATAAPADGRFLEALLHLPIDWGLFPASRVTDVPLSTSAILLDGAGPLDDEARYTLLARARRGARVLATDPGLLGQFARDTEFGAVSRQGEGHTGWLDLSRPHSVANAIEWLGVTPLVAGDSRPSEPLRVIRSQCQRGHFVVVTVASSERREVTLALGTHRVRLGVRRDRPGVVAYDGDGPWLVWSLGAVTINGWPWLAAPDEAYTMLASQLGRPLPEERTFVGYAIYRDPCEIALCPTVWRPGEPPLEYRAGPHRGRSFQELVRRSCVVEGGRIKVELEARYSGLPFVLGPADRLEQPVGRIESLLR